MNPQDRVLANFVPLVDQLAPGPVAVVASSGGVNLATSFLLAEAGVGLRLGVGLGNAIDVGAADVLDWLAAEAGTAAVALHLEGVDDGVALCAAVSRVAASKPVVAITAGNAGDRGFARSHTGRVLGDAAVATAALRRAGALVAGDLDELVAVIQGLLGGRLVPNADPGVGLVTGQAGPGLLVADALESGGCRVPELADTTVSAIGELLPPLTFQRNPVDTGRPGPAFGDVVRLVAEDAAVDVVAVYALEEGDAVALDQALDAAAAVPVLAGTGGPVATLDDRARKMAVPLLRSPARLANAVIGVVEDSRSPAGTRRGRR